MICLVSLQVKGKRHRVPAEEGWLFRRKGVNMFEKENERKIEKKVLAV